ncbi:MAG: class I adenylate-forming enzyme family protein [Planctomycetota bacterium]|jgi:long-chain acyl-CoA synthetase
MTPLSSTPALGVLAELDRSGRTSPGAAAVSYLGRCDDAWPDLSAGDLRRAVASVAAELEASVAPGGIVLLAGPNQCEFVAAFLGILRAGLTVFPVYPTLPAAEIQRAAQRSNAAAMIGTPGAIEAVGDAVATTWELHALTHAARQDDRAPKTDGTGAALLLQSSGTTGPPKIVRRDAASLDAVARNVVSAAGLQRDDRVLGMIPMCHSYGVENALLAPVLAGSSVVAMEGCEPPLLQRALADGVTVVPGIPFVLPILAGACEHHALRTVYSAGGPLPAEVAASFRERTGVAVGQLYGSSEMGSVTFNDPAGDDHDPASVGVPMDGVEIRVIAADSTDVDARLAFGQEGQVIVRAPSMLACYVDSDEPAHVDGFFFTGDLGHLDERGRLSITGRLKLQIDVGGMKVNPTEVEQIICSVPGVDTCAVLAVAVTSTLNRLRALIVPKDVAAPPSIASIRDTVRSSLAAYKVPRSFELRESLPRTATGKVLRHAIEDDAS